MASGLYFDRITTSDYIFFQDPVGIGQPGSKISLHVYDEWTVEFIIRPETEDSGELANRSVLFTLANSSGSNATINGSTFQVCLTPTDRFVQLRSHTNTSTLNTYGVSGTSSVAPIYNQDNHIGISFSFGTMYVSLNGEIVITATDCDTRTSMISTNAKPRLMFGTNWTNTGSERYKGYMKRIAVYKNLAKYTDTFIPPSRPINIISPYPYQTEDPLRS